MEFDVSRQGLPAIGRALDVACPQCYALVNQPCSEWCDPDDDGAVQVDKDLFARDRAPHVGRGRSARYRAMESKV